MVTSFVGYCIEHPEQRFFQALRNWVQENIDADCNSILIAPQFWALLEAELSIKNLRDTFYYEDDRLG